MSEPVTVRPQWRLAVELVKAAGLPTEKLRRVEFSAGINDVPILKVEYLVMTRVDGLPITSFDERAFQPVRTPMP